LTNATVIVKNRVTLGCVVKQHNIQYRNVKTTGQVDKAHNNASNKLNRVQLHMKFKMN